MKRNLLSNKENVRLPRRWRSLNKGRKKPPQSMILKRDKYFKRLIELSSSNSKTSDSLEIRLSMPRLITREFNQKSKRSNKSLNVKIYYLKKESVNFRSKPNKSLTLVTNLSVTWIKLSMSWEINFSKRSRLLNKLLHKKKNSQQDGLNVRRKLKKSIIWMIIYRNSLIGLTSREKTLIEEQEE